VDAVHPVEQQILALAGRVLDTGGINSVGVMLDVLVGI
jgi:hypothetical protein